MTSEASGVQPNRALVANLRKQVRDTVRDLSAGKQEVAIIDFHVSPNPGDNAIWLGQRDIMRRLGQQVLYACTVASYSPREMRRRIGRDTLIYIEGGGNLGDVWPASQRLRERVIADFPK